MTGSKPSQVRYGDSRSVQNTPGLAASFRKARAAGRRFASSSEQAFIFPASGHPEDQTIPVNALNNRCKDIFLSFRSKKNLTRSAQLSKAQGISSEEFDRAVFFFKYFEEIEHADEAESLQHELRRIYQVYHATTLFSRR